MRFLFLIALTPMFFCGQQEPAPVDQEISDSVNVLTFSILEAVKLQHMPGADRIYANDQAAIYLASQSLSTDFLTANLNERFFNIASSDTICAQLNRVVSENPKKKLLGTHEV